MILGGVENAQPPERILKRGCRLQAGGCRERQRATSSTSANQARESVHRRSIAKPLDAARLSSVAKSYLYEFSVWIDSPSANANDWPTASTAMVCARVLTRCISTRPRS